MPVASLKDLEHHLLSLKKQIPYATALALTRTARRIQEAQKVNLESKLENPTPFTVNSVASVGARKTSLRAKVYIRPTAAQYLAPSEYGGTRYLSGRALLNPKNIRLNQYGNIPRNKLARLKARPDVFVGSVGGVNGVWQRKKARGGKSRRIRGDDGVLKQAGRGRRKRSPDGTRRKRLNNRPPKLLIRFDDAQQATPVLGYFSLASQMAAELLPGEMKVALAGAMRTAK